MQQLANRYDQVPALPVKWVKEIFKRMSAFYGTKFSAQWEGIPEAELAQVWAEELAGYTPEEISRALGEFKNRRFPPTLPEFMEMCRPALVPETAFYEAVRGMTERNRGRRGDWSHPAIFWAAVRITNYELMNSGYAVLRARWENALTDILAKGRWESIPDAHVQLPAPGVTKADRDEAAKRMKEMGAAGVLAPKSRDHKAWAHKIIERSKGKDKPSFAALAMAQRALGEATA